MELSITSNWELRCIPYITNVYPIITVEMFASMGNLGISLGGFPAGMMIERVGSRVTSLVSLTVSTLGFLLLWSTTLQVKFYKDHAWLQYIFFFVSGTSHVKLYLI